MGKHFKALILRCIYLRKLDEDLAKLKAAADELIDLRNNVLRRIKICEERQQLKRLEKVQLWLTQSESVVKEAEELIARGPPKNGIKLDKKVSKKVREVTEMKTEGVFEVVAESDHVVHDDQTVGLEPVSSLVWRCLTVENTGIIGLYGVEGVGKTTVLARVNNKLLQHKSNGFDFVIWVFVSKNLNLEGIQDTIREKIGFLDKAWTSKSIEEKARKIFEILSKKRFALFLDDVWEKVDLGKIGMPMPDSQNGSKLVFTTCSENVCKDMGAQTEIKAERLPWDKSWDLFRKNVGEETLRSHPDIPNVAEEVATKCDGLPLALVTIGQAMASKKTPQEWRDALYILSNSTPNFSGTKGNNLILCGTWRFFAAYRLPHFYDLIHE